MTNTNDKNGSGPDAGGAGRQLGVFVGVCPGGKVYLAAAAVFEPGESIATLHLFGSLWPNVSVAAAAVGTMVSGAIGAGVAKENMDRARVIEVTVAEEDSVDEFEALVRKHFRGRSRHHLGTHGRRADP